MERVSRVFLDFFVEDWRLTICWWNFRRVLISFPMWQLARPNPDMLYEGHPPPPPPRQGGGRGALCPPSYSGYFCTLCVYPPYWASSDKQEDISTDPILISNMYTFRWTPCYTYCILYTVYSLHNLSATLKYAPYAMKPIYYKLYKHRSYRRLHIARMIMINPPKQKNCKMVQ
jgi:hypothetical protein